MQQPNSSSGSFSASFRHSLAGALWLAVALAAPGCNEHPLDPIGSHVKIQRSDIFQRASQTKIDVLWMVDNSSSMCEEQASLSAHFNTFIEGLAELKASFHIAVVASEVDDKRPEVAGRFRYAPARVNSQYCINYVACTSDENCGTGGCLCGIPWLRRCALDTDCEAGETCLRHSLPDGGTTKLAYCARACTAEDECQGDISSAARTFHCTDGRCQLRTCILDADCPTGQRCLPSAEEDGAISYCRRFRSPPGVTCPPGGHGPPCPLDVACTAEGTCEPVGFCPPQTCDCPKSAPTILDFDPQAELAAGHAVDLVGLQHRFRCLALLGTDGDTYEKGLEAVERALTPPLTSPGGPNDGFLRDDAYLVVIYLTDENDCSDRGKPCQSARDCPVPDDMACPRDPVEPDRRYCRLPKRETQECEYWEDRLMNVGDLAASIKDLKATSQLADGKACTEQADCAGSPGYYCSKKFGRCTADSGKIIVAGIVGDRDLFCTTRCPSPDGRGCKPSDACEDPCAEGEFCAERVYKQGTRDIAPTCQDLTFGSAYSGKRYHEFLAQFGGRSIGRSICRGQIDDALRVIAELVSDVVPASFCLAQPLPGCTSNEDCREGAVCLTDPQQLNGSPPFCALSRQLAGGQITYRPADLLLEIRDASGAPLRLLAAEDWLFLPVATPYPRLAGKDEKGPGGCIEIERNGPGPSESLVLRYVTPLENVGR